MKKYDYLIVGAGLFGAVFAHEAKEAGKTCLVIDKRNHIAGNIYTDKVKDIDVHQYGAHIFHTSNETVWNYVNRFAKFNRYTNSPVANYKGEIYNMPFNMNTFNKLWGVVTPQEAQARESAEPGRAGNHPDRTGRIYKAGKRLYRETVGQTCHRASILYHQTSSGTFYL